MLSNGNLETLIGSITPFSGLNIVNSDIFSIVPEAWNAQVTFVEKPQMKKKRFQNQKLWYLIQTGSYKAFKGTVLNLILIESPIKLRLKGQFTYLDNLRVN